MAYDPETVDALACAFDELRARAEQLRKLDEDRLRAEGAADRTREIVKRMRELSERGVGVDVRIWENVAELVEREWPAEKGEPLTTKERL
jgi:hypothetical protein